LGGVFGHSFHLWLYLLSRGSFMSSVGWPGMGRSSRSESSISFGNHEPVGSRLYIEWVFRSTWTFTSVIDIQPWTGAFFLFFLSFVIFAFLPERD
jgi:hypothetical protein